MAKDYDYEAARRAGIKGPGPDQHWPSRVPSGPEEGKILKHPRHPTIHKTVAGEAAAGMQFYRKGRELYSGPSVPTGAKPVSGERLLSKPRLKTGPDPTFDDTRRR